MAIATNFRPTQDLKVIIGTEATVGSGTLHGSGAWYQLPMIAPPTINENQVALDMGSQQTGTYTPNHNQMKQRVDNPIWEIQLQFLCGANSWGQGGVYSLFNQGSPPSLDSDYTPPDLTHGATNVWGEYASQAIYIGGAGHRTDYRDQRFFGCVCKSVELSHSIDSNGGFPVITATFVTGYKLDHVDSVSDETLGGGSAGSPAWTDLSGEIPVHFTALTSLVGKYLGETAGASPLCDVRAFGYNLSASRDIQRIGYSGADYDPMSYEMAGGFTVTGDVTFKKDSNFDNIRPYYINDAMCGFKFAGTGYAVALNGKVSDVSNDTGSPELRNTVSFQGAGNPKTSGAFLTTADAGGDTRINFAGHGLSVGQRVTISGGTDVDGDYYVESTYFTADYFSIDNTWSGASASGTWTLHADSKAIVSIDL